MADLTNALTDDELATLRAGYSRAAMNAGAHGALVTRRLPEATGLVDSLLGQFFWEERSKNNFFENRTRRAAARSQKHPVSLELDLAGREMALIPLLAVNGDASQLATHIYWGLMEGLSQAAIARLLLLAGYYQGVEVWSASSGVMEGTLVLLKELVKRGQTTATDVVVAISLTYGEGVDKRYPPPPKKD